MWVSKERVSMHTERRAPRGSPGHHTAGHREQKEDRDLERDSWERICPGTQCGSLHLFAE